MFVGRENELEYLNERYNSDKSEFIVIYGRRRIGKTELIKTFVKNKPHIFYTAVQITDKVQLTKISEVVSAKYESQKYREPFSSWDNLFRFIADHAGAEEKLVVVIDEFPYIVEGNASIPSIFQSAWDHEFKDRNIMFIISGSSMSFMKKEIMSEKNPLYGRATGIYKVHEMDFDSAKKFMPNNNTKEIMLYYSIFSGVPYYLNQINTNKSLGENVVNNILKNGSILFNEAEFLLKQELRDVHSYNSIIEAIALGNTKLNDIYIKTEIDKNKLPYYINNLIDLNIIEREFPITTKTKEMAKSRNGLYKLLNSYFRFYYTFVYHNLSELLEGDAEIIYEEIVEPNIDIFTSLEYEKVCIQKMRYLNRAKKLPFRFTKIGRWWEKGNEIDIVAFNTKGNYIFGECKWQNKKIGHSELEKLKEKSILLNCDLDLAYYILFSKNGFTDELLNSCKEDSKVILIDTLELIKTPCS